MYFIEKHAVIRKIRAKCKNGARECFLPVFQFIKTLAGSLIWRKYCTKVKFSQTLGGGGLKQIS